jgi:hypothetical protein
MEMNLYTEALNALVKGLDRYDTYYSQAKEAGLEEDLDEKKELIYNAFSVSFKMSQSDANQLLQEYRDNFTQYYVKITKIGEAMK